METISCWAAVALLCLNCISGCKENIVTGVQETSQKQMVAASEGTSEQESSLVDVGEEDSRLIVIDAGHQAKGNPEK